MSLLLATALAAALSTPAPAAPAPTAAAASPEGWNAHLRYRHEQVDADAFARDASADTLRLRLGWTGLFGTGWSWQVEGEGVAELSDRFNSTANGETAYPVVLDPRALELNQAWLGWRGERVGVRAGRQRIALDNQRFIGNVGWRQNEQTFDAAAFDWTPRAGTRLQAHWLGRVHRVAGDEARDPLARERSLDGRLLNLQHALPLGQLSGYGYWIEDRDVAAASSRTLGLRWTAQGPERPLRWGLVLEAARQDGFAGGTGEDADYLFVEPRLEHAGRRYAVGFERLGAGDGRAFQTPLATLHAFNGWADQFLVTPAGGLEDLYASVQGGWRLGARNGQWQLAWHDFGSEAGADYGQEWNASLGLALAPRWNALLKLADYRADGFSRDNRKLWLQVEWRGARTLAP